MRNLTLLPFSFAALSLATPASAHAHPVLESTAPPSEIAIGAGKSQVTGPSPKELRLNFSERLMAKFSGLQVKDEEGHIVETGAPTTNPSDAKQLVVPLLSNLAAGRYSVEWHAVSEDTHRVKGRYSFTVPR